MEIFRTRRQYPAAPPNLNEKQPEGCFCVVWWLVKVLGISWIGETELRAEVWLVGFAAAGSAGLWLG